MKNTRVSLTVSALVAGLTCTGTVVAQQAGAADTGTLQEVVVTAEKRTDTVQTTAASIDVVSGDTILKMGENSVSDVLKDVPAVITRNSAQGTTIELRGISDGGVPNNDSAAAVGLSVDGVYNALAGSASQLTFFDVSRVEVLRGPQGTLYGIGAEGGAVNIITNGPVLGQYDYNASLEAGSYDLIHAAGAVNIPISDTLAARIAVNSVHSSGYYTSGASDDVSTSARGKLLYQPTDTVSILVGEEFSRLGGKGTVGGRNAGANAWGLGSCPCDPWDDLATGLWSKWFGQDIQVNKFWLQADATIGPGALTVLPAYVWNRGYTFKAEPPAVSGVTPAAYNIADDFSHTDQKTVEARYASLPTSPWKWVVGYFYSYQNVYNNTSDTMNFTYQTTDVIPKTQAEYGQVTVPVAKDWRVVAGVRENEDQKSFTNNVSGINATPAAGGHSWNHFDWKIGVETDLAPQSMAYATVSTGYRAGSVNAGSSTIIEGPSGPINNPSEFTKPEQLVSYEIGSKNQFLNNTLRVNADIYYGYYTNRQFDNFYFVPLPGICGNGGIPGGGPPGFGNCNYEANGGAVTMLGGEFEGEWLITPADDLALNFAYLDASNKAGPYVANLGPGLTAPLSGATPPNSPRWQGNAYYQHRFDLPRGQLTPRVDVRYTALSYINSYNYLDNSLDSACGCRKGDLWVQPAYTQYDASLGYTSADTKWTLSAYIKNIGNVAVKTDTDGFNTQVGAPRTFGVVLTVHPGQ